MAKYNYNNKIAILVNGKIKETFVNKLTTSSCEATMKRYVVMNKGYTPNSFTLMLQPQ